MNHIALYYNVPWRYMICVTAIECSARSMSFKDHDDTNMWFNAISIVEGGIFYPILLQLLFECDTFFWRILFGAFSFESEATPDLHIPHDSSTAAFCLPSMYVINNNVIPPNVSKPPGARLFRSHLFFCLTKIFCVLIDAIQCDISVLFLPSSIIEIVQCKVMQLPPNRSVFMWEQSQLFFRWFCHETNTLYLLQTLFNSSCNICQRYLVDIIY